MIRAWNRIPRKHSHTNTPIQILAPSHTLIHTYMYTDAYLRNCRCSFVRRFAFGLLCTTPQSTREFIKVCLPTRRERCLTHTYTRIYTVTHILRDRHSSHKQLSRNHNKFTSAAQMFDKKFLKSFHWFRNVSTISMLRRGGGGRRRGCVLAIDIYGPRCYRVDIS